MNILKKTAQAAKNVLIGGAVLSALAGASLVVTNNAGKTYYVRTHGGTIEQCDGTMNKDFSSLITDKKCAVGHLTWLQNVYGGAPGKIKENDKIIIQAGMKMYMGFGSPNSSTTECYEGATYGCFLAPFPDGVKILGDSYQSGCTNPPKLVGVRGLSSFLRFQGSKNNDIRCLDITDEEECVTGANSKACRAVLDYKGNWAQNGLIVTDTENFHASDLTIHGLSVNGIIQARNKGLIFKNVRLLRNGSAGIESDCGDKVTGCGNPGKTVWENVECSENGCGEDINGKKVNCCTQDQGCYGDGCTVNQTKTVGAILEIIGLKANGNTSDGLDALYVDDPTFQINIDGMLASGNAGQALKTNSGLLAKNLILGGNCADFWKDQPFAQMPGFNYCRAAGNTLSVNFKRGTVVDITNLQIIHPQGDVAVQTAGDGCDGSEKFNVTGHIEEGTEYWSGQPVGKYYASGTPPPLGTGNGEGSCGQLKMNFTDTNDNPIPPVCIVDPNSCDAPEPACDQTTNGKSNCGTECKKNGEACPTPPNTEEIDLKSFMIQDVNGTLQMKGIAK